MIRLPRNKMGLVGGALLLAVLSLLLGIVSVNYTEETTEEVATALIAMATKGELQTHRVREDGVPMVRYAHRDGEHANPVYAGMYGLKYYSLWQAAGEDDYFLDFYRIYLPPGEVGDDVWRERFMGVANWYLQTMKRRTVGGVSFGVWEYDTPWAYYELEAPWISAMAQGIAMQVLVRAWQLTGEPRYIEAVEAAAAALYVPVEQGGATRMDSDSLWWYDEYAAPGALDSRVLNGHEHVLLALHEVHAATGNSVYQQLFERGLASLEYHVTQFDEPDLEWTHYDLVGTLAKYKYHHINVYLTRRLGALSGSNALLEAAARWHSYEQWLVVREMSRSPISEKFVLMVLVNTSVAALLLLLAVAVAVGGRRLRVKLAGGTL